MALRSLAEVDDWVAKDGVDALRKTVAEGHFDGSSNKLARAWLAAHDRAEDEKVAQARHAVAEGLNTRATEAAEKSAAAAVSANRIAWLALLVALAALALTGWQLIKAAS